MLDLFNTVGLRSALALQAQLQRPQGSCFPWQRKDLRHREVKSPASGCSAYQWGSRIPKQLVGSGDIFCVLVCTRHALGATREMDRSPCEFTEVERLGCWANLGVSDSEGKVWILSNKFLKVDGLGKPLG